MHIWKNIKKLPFWFDYYRQDLWMRRKLQKLNQKNVDLAKEEEYQQKRMLKYCRKAYPDFYKFYNLKGNEKLEEYPILSKQDMRAHPEIFRSRYHSWISCHSATTGGSTGTPFGFEISANHDPVHQEFLWRLMGYKEGDRILCITGSSVPEKYVDQNIFYYNLSKTQLPYGGYALSCLYLTEETAKYYVEYMEKIRPDFMRGYPSVIYRLAQYIDEHQIKLGFSFLGIELTSESVFEYQIEYIEKVFQTKVFLQYGHTEAAIFAYSYDESHKYRCSPLYGHVEILDQNGKHVKVGETGEVVVTSYSNFAMPFLRYRTGDLAEYGGTKGAVVTLNQVWGRTQDVVYKENGEKIFLTAIIFGLHYKAFSNIKKWKIIQEEYGRVVFRIVKGAYYTKKDEDEIRDNFRIHAGILTKFEYVDDLELTRRGKSVFLEQKLE